MTVAESPVSARGTGKVEGSGFSRRSLWKGAFPALPTLLALLLPKCPFCVGGYLAVLASVGLSPTAYGQALFPATAAMLALIVALTAIRAHRRRRYGPIFLSLLGAGMLLVGKFYFERSVEPVVGAALLVAATLWTARPLPTPLARAHCCQSLLLPIV